MAKLSFQPELAERDIAREQEWFADRERRNPWFRWVMHTGLPLFVSLIVHGGIFAFLAIKSWALLSAPTPGQEIEAGILVTGDVSGGFKWPGEAELAMTAPEAAPIIEPVKFADAASLTELAKMANPDRADDSGGFGVGDSGRSGILGVGSGAGEGGGGGLGSGFGAGTGLGEARVWNLGAGGRNFVYVVDFSGSIIVAQDDLKRELKRSIGALTPKQTFNVVIFFSQPAAQKSEDRFVTESFSPALEAAEPEAKRKLFNWLDRKSPQGQTEPLAAIKRGLALKPDAIFFFSDGGFDEKLADEMTKANEGRKTAIHCLVFDEILLQDASRDPRLTSGAKLMKKIADRNGGKTKIVTGADLGRK